MKKIPLIIITSVLLLSCHTQQQVVQVAPTIQSKQQQDQILKRKVAIARFSNETLYGKGIFYQKENDPISKQAADILSTKLASSEKFILLERQDLQSIDEELKLSGKQALKKVGADYLIVGSVTEFGRKNEGQTGVFSQSKTQTVQAGVSLRLIDVSSGQVIYAEEAKGQAKTKNRDILGIGSQADFDATLSDKAISAAISKLVENVINNCMEKPWRSYFLSHTNDGILISGGKNQGLKVGDRFNVVEKGKTIKNPQTDMMIELPGKNVGVIEVVKTGGNTSQNEYSIVSFTEGSINKDQLTNYYIEEKKQ